MLVMCNLSTALALLLQLILHNCRGVSTPCCCTAGTRLLVVRFFSQLLEYNALLQAPPFFPLPADIETTRGTSIELSVFCLNLCCCSCSYFTRMMQQLEARQANGGITSARMAFELLQREVLFGYLPLNPGCLPFSAARSRSKRYCVPPYLAVACVCGLKQKQMYGIYCL